ncbi:hypothetical protein [Hymenobacter armeniacus]|uniref:Uncharacterized protein n=1 Tax=Hymenobacter armeniacus TaxID=2771358 RepID=A0ABR8JQP9_9BACT|nr:hypothetical protein [Hymenobacter armeniacus]MBD2722302.1 hypothetical protein [Hymenobacter armeniacus]
MDTQNHPLPPENDYRPQDQQDRAAAARPNPNDPIIDASSPNYGEFGGVAPSAPMAASYAAQPTNAAPAGRDGSNDNPDEFSEFRDREKDAHKAPRNPEDQPGHVEQNQDPAAVRATQDADSDVQRAAWAQDDPRYAGGGSHNTRDESADTSNGQ